MAVAVEAAVAVIGASVISVALILVAIQATLASVAETVVAVVLTLAGKQRK